MQGLDAVSGLMKSAGRSDDHIEKIKELARQFGEKREREQSTLPDYNDFAFSWDDSYLPPQEPQFRQSGPMSMVDGSVRGGMSHVPQQGTQEAILPGKYAVNQPFGVRNARYNNISGGINRGADFNTPANTPLAVPPGQWEVVQAFAGARPGQRGANINNGWGNSVMVRNRKTGETLRYSHLNQVGVRPGQVLQGGALLGLSGNTGHTVGQTGNHLDLEYVDHRGRLADVTRSPYARYLFGGK